VEEAIITGFRTEPKIKQDKSAVMVVDNQKDSDYLSKLINPIIKNKADFTKGNRLKKGLYYGMPKYRFICNKILAF